MLEKIKSFLIEKKIWLILGVIALVVVTVVVRKGNEVSFSVVVPSQGTLVRSVEATGQVVSSTDLDLSFSKTGIVSRVKVAVGDKVKKGDVLATLDLGSDAANLTKARAALLAAEAKLKKTIAGASNEEISLAQVNLDNAKLDLKNTQSTQETLVSNAYSKLLNSTPAARPGESTNTGVSVPTISGTYRLGKEGQINLSVYSTGGGVVFSTNGLLISTGSVSTTTPQAIGDSGLYILFSSTTNLSGTVWTIDLPNNKASDYLTNYNAYQAALNTKESVIASAQALVNQREAELALKLATARDADIDLAKADVLSAQGGLEQAQNAYNDNMIIAPANGTITKIDTKYGELASQNSKVITLEDVDNLYVEALINESNIASLAMSQVVSVKFDALPGVPFTGVVSHIDPSSVSSDGVVNYKIKVLLNEKDERVRSGMNAEIAITVSEKENVLSVPKAVTYERDGVTYAQVVVSEEDKKLKEVVVTTGGIGDGNMIEILSGISASDKLAIVEQK